LTIQSELQQFLENNLEVMQANYLDKYINNEEEAKLLTEKFAEVIIMQIVSDYKIAIPSEF